MSKSLLIAKTGSTFGSIRRQHGDFEDWFLECFRAQGLDAVVVDACAGVLPADPGAWAGVVVTGSPAMVTDREPWSEALAQWLRDAAAENVPLLGVCYGHQLLAHAFGGQVDYHPRGREIGTREIRLMPEASEDVLFAGLPETFKGQLTHAQSVIRLPPGAVRLAANDHEPHQAFRLGDRIWGLQFHPEFSATVMAAYIEAFAGQLQEEGRDPQRLLAEVDVTPQAQDLLTRFARVAGVLS